MTIAFPCENCGHNFQVDSSLAGKKCKCKQCGHIFLIPVPRTPKTSSSTSLRTAEAKPSSASSASNPRPAATVKTPRPSPPPAPKPPDPYYAADDPYGFDEEPTPSRRAVRPEEDDEFASLPPRAPKPVELTKVKKKKKRSEGSAIEAAPWWVVKIGLGLTVASALIWPFNHQAGLGAMGFFLFGTAIVLYLMGSIGMLIVPFRESVVCGLMYLFVPFYALIYLITRWDAMKRWFLTTLAGGIVLTPVYLAILLPALQAAQNAAQMAVLRNEIESLPPGSPQRAQKEAEFQARAAQLRAQSAQPQGQNPALPPGYAMGPDGPELRLAPQDPMLADAQDSGPRIDGPANPPTPTPAPAPAIRRKRSVRKAPAPGNGQVARADAPTPTGVPDNAITVRVQGVPDGDALEPFLAKTKGLARSLNGGRGSSRARSINGRTTLYLWPVDDVQAFADGIDFAEVTAVNGRTIDVKLAPSIVPEPAPDDAPPGRRSPAARRGPAIASQAAPADADFINQALVDLKAPQNHKRKDALQRLSGAPPDEDRRGEVAAAIEPLLRDPDSWTRTDAAKALGVWGGPDNTPALLKALKDPQFGVVWAVLDAIKALHDPAAAVEVAAMLNENRERGKAVEALKAMGPEAQSAVLPYLNHNDVFVRAEACKILGQIGTTDETRHAIIAMYRRVNGFGLDANAAKEAIDRIGMPKTPAKKKKSIVPK